MADSNGICVTQNVLKEVVCVELDQFQQSLEFRILEFVTGVYPICAELTKWVQDLWFERYRNVVVPQKSTSWRVYQFIERSHECEVVGMRLLNQFGDLLLGGMERCILFTSQSSRR